MLIERGLLPDWQAKKGYTGNVAVPFPSPPAPATDPDRWKRPWTAARPIVGTLAQTYLHARGLEFNDPDGEVLRFSPSRTRKGPTDEFERHPALLCLLCDILTGQACGLINIFLAANGSDRLRDRKAKTVTGRASSAAVMLDPFDGVSLGLTIAEGPETALAVRRQDWRPVWALGSATNLRAFPVLAGIEGLTIAADAGKAGQEAAHEVTERWRRAGREARIVTAKDDDWAARA